MLLPDHVHLLDEIVNENDTSSLTELDNKNIEQLVPIKEHLILSPSILRQSTWKGKKK